MSLAGRSDTPEAIGEFRGDTHNVAGYLMTEVLAKQPPAIREFLLRTCLLDDFEPGSVEALTGQPSDPRVLEFLAHGNAFVEPVPGRPSHFRYQPLFREFLRSQLTFENAALAAALHQQASRVARSARTAARGDPRAPRRRRRGRWLRDTSWTVSATRVCSPGASAGCKRSWLPTFPPLVEGAEAALTRAAFALAELDARRAASELDAARALLERRPGGRLAGLRDGIGGPGGGRRESGVGAGSRARDSGG